MEWFNSLEPSLKIYWGIALIASAIFVIQMLISLIGGDVFDDVEADGDVDSGDVSHFFSMRNLINFLLGAGWGGVCFYNVIASKSILMLIALGFGTVFVVLFFMMVKVLLKLGKDNTFRIAETLDKTADVYLSIPEKRSSSGKIQISVNGSIHEIDAITANEKIPTGAKVKVVKIVDTQTVEVEKI